MIRADRVDEHGEIGLALVGLLFALAFRDGRRPLLVVVSLVVLIALRDR